MATRANIDLQGAKVKYYTVGTAATAGYFGKFSAEGVVTNCGANESAAVVFIETATTGNRVQCLPISSDCFPMAIVGTGGATAGDYLKTVSDGVTSVGTLGGGTSVKRVVAMALQTGVVGDQIAVQLTPFESVSA
jgi:hypothetical protein